MKRWLSVVLMLVLVLMLTACAPKKEYEDAGDGTTPTQKSPMDPVDEPTDAGNDDNYMGYDPAAEEETSNNLAGGTYDQYGQVKYVGATPIPLEPLDKPTATPRPTLAFNYGAITAENLGLTFEGPIDWISNSAASDAFVLTENRQLDGVTAQLSLRLVNVSSTYKEADIKTDIASMLAEVGKEYDSWTVADLNSRKLLDKPGYYTDYRGEKKDGLNTIIVRGRVHIVLLDGNKTLVLHMYHPGWYNTDYLKIYTKLRDTLKTL